MSIVMGLFLGEWTLPLKKMSNYGEIKWGIENGGYQSQRGLVKKMNFSRKE